MVVAASSGHLPVKGTARCMIDNDMNDLTEHDIDRLSIRTRPRGWPVMRQWWGKLLFMHWRIPAALLRPLIPARLSIDTFDGSAWIALVPFTMWGVRPSFAPPVPHLSAFHELNVRTYVHLDGVPGVWFMSLEANRRLAVRGARTIFHLPYFDARMSLSRARARPSSILPAARIAAHPPPTSTRRGRMATRSKNRVPARSPFS